MGIITGFYSCKKENQDFALTPFLSRILATNKSKKIYGLGFCWGWYCVYIALAFGIPKNYPLFKVHNQN